MKMLEASDEQLAERAQRGDREAFFNLYQRYLKRVYNRVKSKVPPQDVDDVTQEIFTALVRSLGSFERRARFNTWLYTIANRQIADYYRRRGRGGRLPESVLDDDDTLVSDAAAAAYEQVDRYVALQRALNALPEHYQAIILQRFADSLSFPEIADERGQSLEAVKSLFRRAMSALREQMGEVENDSETI